MSGKRTPHSDERDEPISLAPLEYEQALRALLQVDPEDRQRQADERKADE